MNRLYFKYISAFKCYLRLNKNNNLAAIVIHSALIITSICLHQLTVTLIKFQR